MSNHLPLTLKTALKRRTRAIIDKATADMALSRDEYIDPADGLIHCKNCRGYRQTIVPAPFGNGYIMPRYVAPARQKQNASEKRPRNSGTAWRVSSAGGRRDFKTAICTITPLPTTTGKIR